MVRRLLARLGFWCLRRAAVPRIDGRIGVGPTQAEQGPVILTVYVLHESPHVPMLLAGMAKTYHQMHGPVEVDPADLEVPPHVPSPKVH